MKAYKGFGKDMTCRGFKYEEGEKYETDKAELCECGFHACENPLDCLNYYEPSSSIYHEVELDGDIKKSIDDSKVSATKIKIGARLSIAGIVKGAIDFVFSKVKPTTGDEAHSATTGDGAHSATTGDGAHSATTGYRANSATTGDRANSATTGYGAHSATTGYRANSATTGDEANASVEGKDSIATVLGKKCKARGAVNCWLVLTERDEDNHILGVQAVKVDGEAVKANTWYELRGGKVVEAEED